MPDKKLVKMHFSANARNYDLYAHIQKDMAARLMQLLGSFKSHTAARVLDVGSGTGYMTGLLLDQYPGSSIDAVDIAPGMISELRERYKTRRLQTFCADIEDMTLRYSYDMIVSNAVFQWLNSLPATLLKLYDSLSEGGVICFSTFGDGTFAELHDSYLKAKNSLKIDTGSRPGQAFYKPGEIEELCRAIDTEGTEDIIIKDEYWYRYFSSVRDFFTSVRKTGANNSSPGHIHRNPSLITETIKMYERYHSEGSRVKVTYRCIYCLFRKRYKRSTAARR